MKEIIKFSASWCQPCKQLKRALEGVDLGVNIVEIDIDKDFELALKYKVQSVPTLVLLEDEVEKKRLVGMQTVGAIREAFNL